MKTSESGIEIIKHYESLHDGDLRKIDLQPKQCPAGIWTVGWGHALKDINGKWLKGVEGYTRMLEIYPDLETIIEDEADALLIDDLEIFELQLNSLNLPLQQYQFDALMSFCFNLGFKSLLSSTLLRRIKGEKGSVREAFLMWNKADGKVLQGLVRRRQTEATLYEYGVVEY